MQSDTSWSKDQANEIIQAHRGMEGAALPMLHALQAASGFIREDVVPIVAEALNLSRAEVHGIVTFWSTPPSTTRPRRRTSSPPTISDWATNCPEYKVTAVQITPSNGPSEWQENYREQAERSRRIKVPVEAAE
jgi:hypothetical protein